MTNVTIGRILHYCTRAPKDEPAELRPALVIGVQPTDAEGRQRADLQVFYGSYSEHMIGVIVDTAPVAGQAVWPVMA